MGKIKKLKLSRQQRNKDESLTHQILAADAPKVSVRMKAKKRLDEPAKFVSGDLSDKILRQAREQQEELEDDVGPSEPISDKIQSAGASLFSGTKAASSSKPSADSDAEEETEEPSAEADDFYEPIEISEEDEIALEMFMAKDAPVRQSLGELLRGKLSEKKAELDTAVSEPASLIIQKLDPAVVELFQGVRDILRKYRSGKLPKAFKVIPTLPNWEQLAETWKLYTSDCVKVPYAPMLIRPIRAGITDPFAQALRL